MSLCFIVKPLNNDPSIARDLPKLCTSTVYLCILRDLMRCSDKLSLGACHCRLKSHDYPTIVIRSARVEKSSTLPILSCSISLTNSYTLYFLRIRVLIKNDLRRSFHTQHLHNLEYLETLHRLQHLPPPAPALLYPTKAVLRIHNLPQLPHLRSWRRTSIFSPLKIMVHSHSLQP